MYNDPHSDQTMPGSYPQWGQQPPASPYPQSGQFGPAPQPTKLSFKQRFGAMPRWKRFGSIGCGSLTALILFLALCSVIGNALPKQPVVAQPSPTPTRRIASVRHVTKPSVTPTPTPMSKPTPVPTPTPQPTHYPPKTVTDLHDLAAKGDANTIHEFHSESVGDTGVCPQPKREVTVDPSITGQQFAEDLLAYFYAQQLDNPCGSLVLAYHNQAEVNDPNTGGTYTAGMINFDVTDSSGSVNTDPNASNLKHKLTLDVGALGSNQEYVVTY